MAVSPGLIPGEAALCVCACSLYPAGTLVTLRGTEQQRATLAVRDGGCLWADCDRSPAWTEAHYINEWLTDSGYSDLADGVVLCHPHHLLLHTQHWRVIRTAADYWLRPPVEVDPEQMLIGLPSKRTGS